MEITFLGTSTMAPTKERNNTAVYLQADNYGFLFDCAEGTQRQFKFAELNPNKIDFLLISHHHGDHTLGISGLVQTLGMNNYQKTLKIYGPKDTKKYLHHAFAASIFDMRINLEIHEVEDGVIFENDDILIEAKPLDHPVPCLGYSVTNKGKRRLHADKIKKIPHGPLWGKLQKGEDVEFEGTIYKSDEVSYFAADKKITYALDTVVCDNVYELAKDADVLICESTFDEDLSEKAEDYGHMTVKDACDIASKSGVKKLILTHFSARYKTTDAILENAKKYFDNVECAYDYFKVKL